jgi:1-aminocyclopropane-1-carboxylate deaminase
MSDFKMNRLLYTATPIAELKTSVFVESGLRMLIKREDLNHINVSGNKWWKLKYNLEEAVRNGYTTLLTFGGAYSNHIYATAAAARELGLKSIGIVRGEETLPLNCTLSFAKECGMQLHYVSREDYRKKDEAEFIQKLNNKFGSFYLIPEGGTNTLAVKGCAEFARQLNDEVNFDYLCLPVGTGGTIAGMIEGLDSSKQILGFPVLKGGEFLEKEIKGFTTKEGNWQLIHDYHFGGYAKSTTELEKFKAEFEKEFNLPLDLIYTAKMMSGVVDLVKKGFFKKKSTILILHTGGLQGKI